MTMPHAPATTPLDPALTPVRASRATMKAAVFVAPGRIELHERPVPEIGPTDDVYASIGT